MTSMLPERAAPSLEALKADESQARRLARARRHPFDVTSILLRLHLIGRFGPAGVGLHEAALGGPERVARQRLTLRPLIEAAGETGEMRLFAAAQQVSLPPLPLIGRPETPGITIAARALYLAPLAEATALHLSGTLRHQGAAPIDIAPGEEGRYPVRLEADHLTWDRQGEGAAMGLPPGRVQKVDEAIGLHGPLSLAWGHSLLDFAPKLMMAEAHEAVPRDAPILIDRRAGLEHGELLRLLSGGRRQIIHIPPHRPVQVRRLWVGATPEYTPYIPVFRQTHEARLMAMNPGALAAILPAGPVLEPGAGSPRKVYFDRSPGLSRQVENGDAVWPLFEAAGYVRVFPETLSVEDQLRLVGGLSHYAGPIGSNLLLAMMFGAPQARAVILHMAELEESPLLLATAMARGQQLAVVLGAALGEHGLVPGNADYRVELAEVAAALEMVR